MSRFYTTLPSNSFMEYYSENTAACYTTKLADTVELEGDWEVVLAEMSISGAVYNVVANQCYYTISLDNVHFYSTIVPESIYRCLSDLLAAMHSTMPKTSLTSRTSSLRPRAVSVFFVVKLKFETFFVIGRS